MNIEKYYYALCSNQPTLERIKEKKELFISHFQEALNQKIRKYADQIEEIHDRKTLDYFKIVLGTEEEKNVGQKTRMFIEAIDWIPFIPGTDIIPGMNTGVHLIVKGAQIAARLDYVLTREIKLGDYKDKFELRIDSTRALIKETAIEIARIFEFQIAILKLEDIEKVAEHATKRIIKGLAQKNLQLNRNNMLESLMMSKLRKLISIFIHIIKTRGKL